MLPIVKRLSGVYRWRIHLTSSVMLVRSASADVFFRVHEQQLFKKRVQIIRHEKLLDTGRVCSRRRDRDYYIVYGVCARCVRSVTDSDLFWALRPTPRHSTTLRRPPNRSLWWRTEQCAPSSHNAWFSESVATDVSARENITETLKLSSTAKSLANSGHEDSNSAIYPPAQHSEARLMFSAASVYGRPA